MDTNQPMPSALATEKAVLSCMMQVPQRFIGRAAAEGIDAECFFHTREMFSQILEFWKEHPDHEGEIELIGFVSRLQMNGTLDRVGGPSEITDIMGYAQTLAGWTSWGNQLRECKARRLAITEAPKLFAAADSEEAIRTAKATLDALTAAVTGRMRSVCAEEAAEDFMTRTKANYAAGDIPGKSTGLPTLDAICGGMRPGEFWVIGGKPTRGKSVLMLQIGAAFIDRGETVGCFTLEMMTHEVIGRLVCFIGRVDYGSITQPKTAKHGEFDRMQRGVDALKKSKLWIDDSGGQNVDTIQAECERIRDTDGNLSLIIVDYLQLIRNRQPGENREQETARMSASLKQLAKKMNCPVLTGSQLNEDGQTRESRAIEQDADALLIITDDGVSVVKMRNGQRGAVLDLWMHGNAQRFRDCRPPDPNK